jgi:hypothetical protein
MIPVAASKIMSSAIRNLMMKAAMLCHMNEAIYLTVNRGAKVIIKLKLYSPV